VFPNDYYTNQFGSISSNPVPAGTVIKIALATNSSANVTGATFSITSRGGYVSSATFPFPPAAQYPISGFQVDLVGPGNFSSSTFNFDGSPIVLPAQGTLEAGVLTYSVSAGTLSDQGGGVGARCGEYPGAITGETSNALYGPVTPSSGPTVTQSLSIPTALGAIAGTVQLDTDGELTPAGATIVSSLPGHTTRAVNGTYVLTSLKPGTVELSAWTPRTAKIAATVAVAGGETTTQDFILTWQGSRR
jgi:hypothetical protein